MPTNDYLIGNAKGDVFRADLNEVLQAIVSNNSSATEPTTTFAYMWWVDTTTGLLKLRNSSNLDWVNILDLTTGASVAMAINDLTDAITDNADNLALGENALSSLTSGSNNTALGIDALKTNTAGNNNTAIGALALWENVFGNDNLAMGLSALQDNVIGNRNTALGRTALSFNTGSDNTAIGYNCTNATPSDSYAIILGSGTVGIGSNYLTFGKNGASDRIYNQFTANAVWTRVSDKRVKKDIKTNKDCGLGFINDLRPVTYKFKAPSELDPSMSEYDKDNDKPSHDKKMYGFIAQEVKEALDKHDIKNFAGHHQIDDGKDNMQGISYEMFVMPLVSAVQELSKENQDFAIENQNLSDRIDEQNAAIDDMMVRIEALENQK